MKYHVDTRTIKAIKATKSAAATMTSGEIPISLPDEPGVAAGCPVVTGKEVTVVEKREQWGLTNN